MIRYYCQYSYGGFKTFRINGESHEQLTQVVTAENNYGFPPLADLYFNQGGAKLLYRFLGPQTLSLIVKEIPGHGLDTDNRPISCAVQFIGDAEDRGVLDRLTIQIANNLDKFEKAFADMFDLRGGLHFEGDKLVDIVKECEPDCGYEGDSRLLRVSEQSGTVLLFVPFSDNFGRDEKVTAKILSELQLPNEACDENKMVHMTELMKMQYLLKPVAKKEKKDDNMDTTLDVGKSIEKLETELVESQEENSHLRSTIACVNKELSELKKKDAKFTKTLCLVLAIVCAVFFILVVTKCYTLSWILLAGATLLMSYKTYKTYKLFKP